MQTAWEPHARAVLHLIDERVLVRFRLVFGSVPEWLMGADCKSAGSAYVGSNPTRPIHTCPCSSAVEHSLGKGEVSSSSLDKGFSLPTAPGEGVETPEQPGLDAEAWPQSNISQRPQEGLSRLTHRKRIGWTVLGGSDPQAIRNALQHVAPGADHVTSLRKTPWLEERSSAMDWMNGRRSAFQGTSQGLGLTAGRSRTAGGA